MLRLSFSTTQAARQPHNLSSRVKLPKHRPPIEAIIYGISTRRQHRPGTNRECLPLVPGSFRQSPGYNTSNTHGPQTDLEASRLTHGQPVGTSMRQATVPPPPQGPAKFCNDPRPVLAYGWYQSGAASDQPGLAGTCPALPRPTWSCLIRPGPNQVPTKAVLAAAGLCLAFIPSGSLTTDQAGPRPPACLPSCLYGRVANW